MGYFPNDKEFQNVIALSGPKRYDYLVSRVADFEELISLRSEDGWVMAGTSDGRQCLPVWPFVRFAQACATGIWTGSEPTSIPLDAWITRWLPGMDRDNVLIAAFPTPSDTGVVVSPSRFKEDLDEALAQFA
jgi:hypothetical protein